MAVIRCPICGGELKVNADMSVGVCRFCDSLITIPKNLERKENLFNRAVFLRQNCDFKKAAEVYEDILKEDNLDPDAHWGLVLCRYGIEYVQDEPSGERKPTCHRTREKSILADPDYKAALEYADVDVRRVIEQEAKRIHEIQNKILIASRSEPPYDIFLCYKETDEFGERTVDSTLAQDIYRELIRDNYKVFFARKTLENCLGSEYEPVIYAALSSAKIMVVVGTKPEHFNATWVRNEWSRFLEMAEGKKKTLIPAYRNMSPYELPLELSSLQALDMSRIGFMQDLLDGIERCIGGAEDNRPGNLPDTFETQHQGLDKWLRNGDTFLRLKNYAEAEKVYLNITQSYPEEYRGWWGLIISKTCDFQKVTPEQDKVEVWFTYMKTLSPEDEYYRFESQYLDYLKLVAEDDAEHAIDKARNNILELQEKVAKSEEDVRKLKKQHEKVGDTYQSMLITADEKVRQCKEKLDRAISKERTKHTLGAICLVAGLLCGGFSIWLGYGLFTYPLATSDKFLLWIVELLIVWIAFSLLSFAISCFSREKSEQCRNELNLAISEKTKQEDQISQSNIRFQSEIKNIERCISNSNLQAEKYTLFVNEHQDEIQQYFYIVHCKKIGIEERFNGDVSMLSEIIGVPLQT